MTDTKDPNTPEETEEQDPSEEDEKEGEGGKSDEGAMGRSEVEVTEGFYTYMASIGASVSQISEVLMSWRHLQGKGLLQALKDFAGRKSRASAHAEVEIKSGKQGMIESLLDKLKSLRQERTQELEREQKQKQRMDEFRKQQMKRQNDLGPNQNGPKF